MQITPIDENQEKSFSGFASYIVRCGLLSREQVSKAIEGAAKDRVTFALYLIRQNLIETGELAKHISQYFGFPLFNLKEYDLNTMPEDEIIKSLAGSELIHKKYGLPLFISNKLLYIGVVDPTMNGLNDLSFLSGWNVRLVIVDYNELQKLFNTLSKTRLSSISSELDQADLMRQQVDIREENGASINLSDIDSLQNNANSGPVVKFINEVLLNAVNNGASDIHFEPYDKTYRIRFRLDGLLYEVSSPPIELVDYFVARLKVMSNLDIAERRLPQDGRFRVALGDGRQIDFRVSTCPMLRGEKIVLRILNAQSTKLLNIEALGFDALQKTRVIEAINKSQGITLVTGPTGSGKTITLYTMLDMINTLERNISTVEDPIEMELNGINQVAVNHATNLTFSTALRSFLRQDPDVIMVGEIRDLDTAETAVRAAQTGHLVLSTLHTNSAPETIVRLANMGIASFNIANSLSLVIAQRLVRKLCPNCKQKIKIPDNVLLRNGFNPEEINSLELYGPGSCGNCKNGYSGRIGIFEVMPTTSEEIKDIIVTNNKNSVLTEQARAEGVISIREAGLNKVRNGVTTLDEVNRVSS